MYEQRWAGYERINAGLYQDGLAMVPDIQALTVRKLIAAESYGCPK